MFLNWDKLSLFRANQSLFFPLNAACLLSRETANTDLIVFGFYPVSDLPLCLGVLYIISTEPCWPIFFLRWIFAYVVQF